ncbi:Mycobacteriophage D29, Gp61 [uncultured Caudovirales phage]|uniref:Mycobacteriophage D29, Gp61 n=1 Tax=uncultured Caudovirales phage TaxID=2100421 RepID=A0A6J5LMI3_9CAUD|nr:Mycobacteriophage D29, Gp61 [uncultured Caudovirales phage]
MRLAIIGSRDFTDYAVLHDTVIDLINEPITAIISGGARGADSLAKQFADEYSIPLFEHLPDYARYGRFRAPNLRNITIIDNCDYVIAFWNGTSPGTRNAINYAYKAKGKEKVKIIPV